MLPLSCFKKEMLLGSSVEASAESVYSALHDPVTAQDRYEAARHSSKRFWDIALLGGPRLVRHGGRDLMALRRDTALKQMIPGAALSAAAFALLPVSGIISSIYCYTHPRDMATQEAAFVHRLKTAITVHRRDINSQRSLSDPERESEMAFSRYARRTVGTDRCDRVRNSNSLNYGVGVWRRLVNLMPTQG